MSDKKFNLTFDFDANVGALKSAISTLQTDFKNLKLPDNIGNTLEKKVGNLVNELDELEKISSKAATSMKDVSRAERSWDKISDLIGEVNKTYNSLLQSSDKKLISTKDLENFKKLDNLWKNLNTEQVKATKQLKSYNEQITKLNAQQNSLASKRTALNQEKSNLAPTRGAGAINLTTLGEIQDQLVKRREEQKKLLSKQDFSSEDKKSITNLEKQIKLLEKEESRQQKIIARRNEINKQLKEINDEEAKNTQQLDNLKNQVKDLEDVLKGNSEAAKNFRKTLEDVTNLDLTGKNINELKDIYDKLGADEAAKVRDALKSIGIEFNNVSAAADTAEKGIEDYVQSAEELSDLQREIDQLNGRLKQFFSFASGFHLLTRAIRSAVTAVKELDEVMTETAVVTDFTVSDMWKQLPQYTKTANELGVATKDVYKSATLYYQQGLKQEQVEQLNIATLKMARIAGLDAAEATDRMTNALRGFNMELNETNANRVADVYSKLAAITASDVDEISTAMTKTASIASNAGMQFETTAAFLSQIIETTRESAETAGTALKTVIARFQELKKSPSEIGEVEGEIVDANKVEGALRSVGISLRDTSGQFRNLDEVFLELSKKWDSLDKNTQRYIATIAAGSRQQSRFIAMMQNYAHTVELVDAANNSAGASQKQYEKTLESLESKLAKLKNAWNEFVLGIANSDFIKQVVDALTTLLNVINKLTGDSGLAKLVTSIGIFTTGRRLVNVTTGILSLTKGLQKSSEAMNVAGSAAIGLGQHLGALQTNFKGVADGTVKANAAITKLAVAMKGNILVLGQWVLGIGAAIAALVVIYKLIQKNSIEGRLKNQNELVEKLEDNLNKTTNKVEELKTAFESLGEDASNLDNLTEGTKEWKQALHDTNMEVLDLIERFPELSKYVKRDEKTGLLTIDEEGYQSVINNREEGIKKQELGLSFQKIIQNELSSLNARKDLYNKLDTGETLVSYDMIDKIAEAISRGEVTPEYFGKFEAYSDQIGAYFEDFKNYIDLKWNNDVNTELRYGEIERITIEDATLDGSEALVKNLLPENLIQEAVNNVDWIALYEERGREEGLTKAKQDYVKAYWGEDAVFEGNKVIINGEVKETLSDSNTDVKKIYTFLAQLEAIKNLSGTINSFGEEVQNSTTNLKLLGDVEELTVKDLENFDIEKVTTNIWDNLSEDTKKTVYQDSILKFYGEVKEQYSALENLVAATNERLKKYGQGADLLSGLKEGSRKGLLDQLGKVEERSGRTAATIIFDTLIEALKDKTIEQQEAALTQFNAVDWSSRSGLEGLKGVLVDLGITIDGEVIDKIITLNGAIDDLAFDKLTEKLENYSDTIKTIQDKLENGEKTFNKEDYLNLIGLGVDQKNFAQIGTDEYAYQGDIKQLLEYIYDRMIQLADDNRSKLTEGNQQLVYSSFNSGREMLNAYPKIDNKEALQQVQNLRIEENNLQVQLNKTTKAFRENNKTSKASDEILTSLVIDIDATNKKLKKYVETYDDLEDVLNNTNKDSVEYAQALSTLGSAASEIFGVDFNGEQIQEYADDLIALAKGGKKGEEAFNNLSKAAAEFILQEKFGEEAGNKLNDVLNILDQADFDIEGTADFTDIFNKIVAVVKSAEKAQEILNSLGYEAEFEYEKVPILVDEFGNETDGRNGGTVVYVEVLKSVVGNKRPTDFSSFKTPKTSGGGSSKKENNNKWDNPYNILYNHIERVNELLRERNKIEFEYNKLVRDTADSVATEAKYYHDTLANLEEQRKEQQYIYNQAKEGYREQLKDIPIDKYLEEIEDSALRASAKARISGLAKYNFEANQVEIDWKGIKDLEDELKTGGLSDDEAKILEAFEKVTSYLKDTESNMDSAEDALRDIDNAIYDFQEGLRQSYIDFENRVISAIENIRQQEIDNQRETNEALDSAADDLIGAIRTNIDKMRRDRANENTEEELMKKERRLAYLRMDTSGSHNSEILKLEKELRDARIDYADTLVDQSLDEMQEQNDAAAAQRERQITLMEDQLEWDKRNGIIAQQAAELIEESKNLGYVTEDSALYKTLFDGEGWAEKSVTSLGKLIDEVNIQFSRAITVLKENLNTTYKDDISSEMDGVLKRLATALESGDIASAERLEARVSTLNQQRNRKIDLEGSDWKKYTVDELIQMVKNGTYDSSIWDVKNSSNTVRKNQPIILDEDDEDFLNEANATTNRISQTQQKVRDIMSSGQRIGESGGRNYDDFDVGDYVVTNGGVYQIIKKRGPGDFESKCVLNIDKKQFRELGGNYRYASGGLADFTGPAWLDGTRSRPEIVLNARDSENLIQLRDILRNHQNSGTSIGDTYFDIDINVDEIGTDYDVDKLVDRIKTIIYTDATRYQNYMLR